MRIKLPKPGDTRLITRFLWLPKVINGERRWLERSSWIELYTYNDTMDPTYDDFVDLSYTDWWPLEWQDKVAESQRVKRLIKLDFISIPMVGN